MHPIPTRILLLLVFSSSLVAAANFTQCLQDFVNDPNAVGGVDSKGQPTSPAEAAGLTYEACTARCGTGPEAFNWRTFAQLFSAWLLPWLALISQLPFGSESNVSDFISVVISLGSPALAAYSLVLTSLNTRSAYRRVKRAELQNRNSVTRALISVQQASLELTADDRLPDNYHWFKEVRGRLHRRNAWSIATASSVAWVVIAYLFTLVDSFVSLNDGTNNPSEGQAVGTIWLWLICLVIGWLWVPTFTHHELKSAIDCANEKATDKTDEKATDKAYESIKRNTSDTYSSVITHGISEMPILTVGHEIPMGQPVTDPVLEIDGENEKANVRSTEEATSPAGLLIYKVKDRLNWDEHRLAATFNYSRFIRHRVLVDSVLRALDKSINKKDEPAWSVFPPGVLTSMFIASILAIILQCGTTAAAALIMIFTPVIGLGCRSVGHVIYGAVALLILFLTIISTISARISETRNNGQSTTVKDYASSIAITLRRICLVLAFINATGLIALSCFQFSSFLDNCYCGASVLGRGTDSFIIINFEAWIPTMRIWRSVATALAAASMAVYMGSLWFMSSLPADIDRHDL